MTETVLTDEQIKRIALTTPDRDLLEVTPFARAVESAVLQSPEIVAMRKDAELLRRARDVMQLLLDTAQIFEKQASRGTGGRRGGPVFEKARAVIAAIDAAMEAKP